MRIAISGASGLVGTALAARLESRNDTVIRLVRHKNMDDGKHVYWNPISSEVGPGLDGLDAFFHLAGENIAAARWTAARKRKILDSRVQGTKLLVEHFNALPNPPKVFLCASAIGFYGNRGNEWVDETSPAGEGFLSEVCQAWEDTANGAASAETRVICLRLGIVLSRKGGALAKMLPLFKLGLGGVLGSGKQYMSWITLDDLIEALLHVISRNDISGPVNCVSSTPVTNREFTQALGKVLHRPAILPAPGFALRMALGEMAQDLLLDGVRVKPGVLESTGFGFLAEDIITGLQQAIR
jgi:uncharacterized protein (TIGR01777 family)